MVDTNQQNGGGEVLDPEVEELWSSRALLLVLLLLILSFWTSYYLKVRRIRTVHETIVALFAGMFVGLAVRIAPGVVVQNMITFKNTILLNVLLPPIILSSGYDLRQEQFFRNFAVILSFAFAGTVISAVVLGVIVYLWSLLGLEGLSLTIVECLIFGTTLSATDPVTILAIFNALKVDPKLYSVIFGESILNDAVAIVMYETLSQFHGEKIHVLSFFHGVGIFLLIFMTSMALGVVFGLVCSLMLKHSSLGHYTEIETCLVLLIAYTSYFFSNALTMSGIVTLLFCGITLKHYAYHNMSRRTQKATKYMFQTLAQLSENFIFIYLGLSLFTQANLVYKPLFILVTALGVCVARYCAVFPISKIINLIFRARNQRGDELPQSYQMMLFWAGLRGAVGVALAAGIKGENATALKTTVLVTVVLTMVIFGGTTSRMIEILAIRTGVDEDEESSDEEGGYHIIGAGNGSGRPSNQFSDLNRGLANGSKYALHVGEEQSLPEPGSPYRDRDFSNRSSVSLGRLGANVGTGGRYPSSAPPYHQNFSSHSIASSSDSDQEPLPTSVSLDPDGELPPPGQGGEGAEGGQGEDQAPAAVWRDGQWFTVLDERYLLPVFSNATASRRQASKKAMRSKRTSFINDSQPEGMAQEGDLGASSSSPVIGSTTPVLGSRSSWLGMPDTGASGGSGSGRATPKSGGYESSNLKPDSS